jgi:hypothetical protein
MAKIDFMQQQKDLYNPPAKQAVLVEVPDMSFLMIDGTGDPNNSQPYQEAVSALYSLSYTLKFTIKKGGGPDYRVSALEGLWWVDDLSQLSMTQRDNWKWTMMIRQPEEVTAEMVEVARQEALRKKGLEALNSVRQERFHEGLAAQIMYIGPYSAEQPTIERLHAFVAECGKQLRDKHHEIYLSDPNKAAPEKLKTILRHPVE